MTHTQTTLRTFLILILILGLGVAACERPAGDDNPGAPGPVMPVLRTLSIDGHFGAIADMEVDSRGNIYVADPVAQNIRVFSPRGDSLYTFGRRGGGPGEFQSLRDLAIGPGDVLHALDTRAQRVSAFATDQPRLVSTFPVGRSREAVNYDLFVLSTDTLMVQYVVPRSQHEPQDRPHVVRLRAFHRAAGPSSAPVLTFPEKEFLVHDDPKLGFSVGTLPYGKEPVLRVGPGDRLYYGWTDSSELRVYDHRGARVGSVQLHLSRSQVDPNDVTELLKSFADDGPGRVERGILEAAVKRGAVPRSKPVYRTFLVDEDGRIWVQPVSRTDRILNTPLGMRYVGDTNAPCEWRVLDERGRNIGIARLPATFVPEVLRSGAIYGVEEDELGVQHVVRYQIG